MVMWLIYTFDVLVSQNFGFTLYHGGAPGVGYVFSIIPGLGGGYDY